MKVLTVSGKSIKGVFALARNMKARVVGCLKWGGSGIHTLKVVL